MKIVRWAFTNLCLLGDIHRFGDMEGHKWLNEHDPYLLCLASKNLCHTMPMLITKKGEAVSQSAANSDTCPNTLWCVFRMYVFLGGPGHGAQLLVAT